MLTESADAWPFSAPIVQWPGGMTSGTRTMENLRYHTRTLEVTVPGHLSQV